MEHIKEKDLFQVFASEDQKIQNRNPELKNIIHIIKDNYSLSDISDNEKASVRKSLKRYLNHKQGKFSDKRLKIYYSQLQKIEIRK